MNFKKKFQSKSSNVIEFPTSRAAEKSNVARGKTKKDDRLNQELEAARASHPGLEKHFQLLSKLHLSPYDVATSLEVPYAQKHPLFCVSFEDAKSIQKTSIFKEAVSLLELARDNVGLRPTQTGNLKPDLCKYLWEKFYKSNIYYEAPRNELDLFQITRIKSLLLLAGYLDFRSKTCLELTDDGKDFLLHLVTVPDTGIGYLYLASYANLGNTSSFALS